MDGGSARLKLNDLGEVKRIETSFSFTFGYAKFSTGTSLI